MILEIKQDLNDIAKGSEYSSRFFKTGVGQYSYGDVFIGAPVSKIRLIAKKFKELDFDNIAALLTSKINEERLLALIILSNSYQVSDERNRDKIFTFYLNHLDFINNWNLVDSSAHLIIGKHIYNKDRNIILNLALSNNLWHRRVAIVATWHFIKLGDLFLTFKIAEILLGDKEDLIHKATGWMLREAGKVDKGKLVLFLKQHKSVMPRTMLRYAIEKFSTEERKEMMNRNF